MQSYISRSNECVNVLKYLKKHIKSSDKTSPDREGGDNNECFTRRFVFWRGRHVYRFPQIFEIISSFWPQSPILSDMSVSKNFTLEQASDYLGLSQREIILLAQRGEIVRIKRDGEFVYRIKIRQSQAALPSPSPAGKS